MNPIFLDQLVSLLDNHTMPSTAELELLLATPEQLAQDPRGRRDLQRFIDKFSELHILEHRLSVRRQTIDADELLQLCREEKFDPAPERTSSRHNTYLL